MMKILTALSISVFTLPVFAVDLKVNVSGEVFFPPCVINNGKAIDVDLGSINYDDINGINNAKSVDIPVSCTYYEPAPYVTFMGAVLPGAPNNVLKADKDVDSAVSMGIALYEGEGVAKDRAINITGLTSGFPLQNGAIKGFTLTAVPFKNSTKPFSGNFRATAVMTVKYL